MLIISEAALRRVQQSLVEAMHEVTDENGQRVVMSTIDSRQLSAASKAAITVVAGETVWPSDQLITVPKPREIAGPFRIVG